MATYTLTAGTSDALNLTRELGSDRVHSRALALLAERSEVDADTLVREAKGTVTDESLQEAYNDGLSELELNVQFAALAAGPIMDPISAMVFGVDFVAGNAFNEVMVDALSEVAEDEGHQLIWA